MSGALGFITANPATRGYDQQFARGERTRRRDEAVATDTAIREGVGEMLAAPPAPAPASGPAMPRQTGLAQVTAPAAAPAQSTDDLDIVARILHGEAGGEGEQGMAAAAHVIRNRAALTGMTPAQVVQARGQFEPYGNPETRARLMALPPEQIAAARQVLDRVMNGELPDPTGGATHFLNPDMQRQLGRAQPAWAPEGQGTRIGRHVFYSRPGDFSRSGAQPPAATPTAGPSLPPAQIAQPTNPYGPVLSRLTATPGAGGTALNLLQRGETEVSRRLIAQARASGQAGAQDARARAATERNIIYALGQGQVDIARHWARQIGMQLPEELLQNTEARTRFAAASNLASRHYRNDPAQASRFVQTYMQTGSVERAAEAAGVPAGAPATWRVEMLRREDQDFLAFVNPRTREIVPAQMGTPAAPGQQQQAQATPPAEGAPPAQAGAGAITRPTRTGSPVRPSAIEERRRVLEAAGYTPQQAAQIAGGGFASETQRMQAFTRLRTGIEQSVLETREPQRTQEIARRMATAMDEFNAMFPRMPAPGGAQAGSTAPAATPPPAAAPAAPAAPQPARPPARPASVPPGSQWSPSLQQWRSPDRRQFFTADGAPIS